MTNFDEIRDQYDKYALQYHNKLLTPENSFWNNYIERPAMAALLEKRVKGKRVLDLGCGSGLFTRMLKDWGANVIGSDISKSLVDIAKKENPDIEFVVENATHTGFSDASFDFVTSSMMVHYFEDLRELFVEVYRVLRTDGEFIFSMQHPFKEALKTIKDGEKRTYILDKYNTCEKKEFEMTGMKLTTYTHTVQMIFESLIDSGFEVMHIVEPLPIEESKVVHRAAYEKCMKIPTIMVYRAKKS